MSDRAEISAPNARSVWERNSSQPILIPLWPGSSRFPLDLLISARSASAVSVTRSLSDLLTVRRGWF